MSDAPPRAPGVQEQVAVPPLDDTVPQPEIVVPPSLKFTDPACETFAVMVIAPPRAASVALPGSEIVIVVDALLIVIVSCLVPLCGVPAESVETTFLT